MTPLLLLVPVVWILVWASSGSGLQQPLLLLPHTGNVRHYNLVLPVVQHKRIMTLLAVKNDQIFDNIHSSSKNDDDNIITVTTTSRRTWCRNALLCTLSVMTPTKIIGTNHVESSEAIDTTIPAAKSDPLVTFGESLSSSSSVSSSKSTTSSSENINNSIIRPSTSSWPHNAAHPLPTLNDPIIQPPVTSTSATTNTTSSSSSSPPPALDQVLQQVKSKKVINPTTHG